MKFLLLLFFSLIIIAMYVFSVSSPSVIFLTVRRCMREQRMSPVHRNGHDQNKVLDQETKQMTTQEHFREQQHLKDLELVYQIDYHGATTHPIPTPKHPRP